MSRDGREERGGARWERPHCAAAPPPAGARGPGARPRRRRRARNRPRDGRAALGATPGLANPPPPPPCPRAAPRHPRPWQGARPAAGTGGRRDSEGWDEAGACGDSQRRPALLASHRYPPVVPQNESPTRDTDPGGSEAGRGSPHPQNSQSNSVAAPEQLGSYQPPQGTHRALRALGAPRGRALSESKESTAPPVYVYFISSSPRNK